MSPQSVMTYILGGKLKNGFEISPKYIGNKNIVEVSIARGIKKVIHTTTNRRINSFTIELPIIDDDDLLDLLFTA